MKGDRAFHTLVAFLFIYEGISGWADAVFGESPLWAGLLSTVLAGYGIAWALVEWASDETPPKTRPAPVEPPKRPLPRATARTRGTHDI